MASPRVTRILAGLTDGLPAAGLFDRLVGECARAVPVTGVGLVSTSGAGTAGLLAVTDGPAALMEEVQCSLGEGPCIEAGRSGRPVVQSDLAATGTDRWPGFTGAALAAGIRAVFAFPLQVGAIRVGVLGLYRDRAGVLPDGELAEALAFVDAATSVVLRRHAHPSLEGLHGSLPVLVGRAEVHQATGMVSVHAGVSLADALSLLQARAFAAERPIVELARDVLGGRIRFTPDGDGPRG